MTVAQITEAATSDLKDAIPKQVIYSPEWDTPQGLGVPYGWRRVRKSSSPMTAAAASNSATGSTGVAFKRRLRTTPARRTTSVTTNTPRALRV